MSCCGTNVIVDIDMAAFWCNHRPQDLIMVTIISACHVSSDCGCGEDSSVSCCIGLGTWLVHRTHTCMLARGACHYWLVSIAMGVTVDQLVDPVRSAV